jgi:hypothetical protein
VLTLAFLFTCLSLPLSTIIAMDALLLIDVRSDCEHDVAGDHAAPFFFLCASIERLGVRCRSGV